MNNGPADETVTLRHDMRNAARGISWRCPIDHRTAAAYPIWRPYRTPSSVRADPRPRPRRHAHGDQTRSRSSRAEDGVRPPDHRRRRQPRPGDSPHRGAGSAASETARRPAEVRRPATRADRLPGPALLWKVFGAPPARRALGAPRTVGRAGVPRCRASPRAAARPPGDRRPRPRQWSGRHRPTTGRVVACDVPCAREGRAVPGSRRSRWSAPTEPSPCAPSSTTKATATRRSPPRHTSFRSANFAGRPSNKNWRGPVPAAPELAELISSRAYTFTTLLDPRAMSDDEAAQPSGRVRSRRTRRLEGICSGNRTPGAGVARAAGRTELVVELFRANGPSARTGRVSSDWGGFPVLDLRAARYG